jgi:hypothetical protein
VVQVVQANPHFLEKNKIERKMNFWKEIEVPFSLDHLDHLGSPPVLWEAVLVTGAGITVAGPRLARIVSC